MDPLQFAFVTVALTISAVGVAMHAVVGRALLRTLWAALGHALTDTSYHRPGITGGRAVTPDHV